MRYLTLLLALLALAPALASAQRVTLSPAVQAVAPGDTAVVTLTLHDAAGRSVRPTSRVTYEYRVDDVAAVIVPGAPTTIKVVPIRDTTYTAWLSVTWRHSSGTSYTANARINVAPPPPPAAPRVDTVRLVDTVHVPVAAAADTAAILRTVCMHLPYTTRELLVTDTVTIYGDLNEGINHWCAFAEVVDSTTVSAAGAASAGGTSSLLGAIGAALLGTAAAGAAVVTRRRQG